MPNMSYCRFENTARDLADVAEHWDDGEPLSKDELRGKRSILRSIRDILNSFGAEVDDEAFDDEEAAITEALTGER